MSAPLKESRQKCWDARDLYFKCLDENNDDKTKCQKNRGEFENSCSKTWVNLCLRLPCYSVNTSEILLLGSSGGINKVGWEEC